MHKYITLAGTVIMTFLTAYSLPVTITNPSMTNIIICGLFALFAGLGFYTFINAGKKKEVTIGARKLIPVED